MSKTKPNHQKQMGQNEKSLVNSETSRWTTDAGAIPGEPYDYLDIPIAGQEGKARRESGEDKREFDELLKQDWLGLDLRSDSSVL
jgi:hypothetical protein